MKTIKSFIVCIIVGVVLMTWGCKSNSQSRDKAIAQLKDTINDKTFLDFTLGDSLSSVIQHLDSLKEMKSVSNIDWESAKKPQMYWCGDIPIMDSVLVFNSKFIVLSGRDFHERSVRCELQFYEKQLFSLCVISDEQADTLLIPDMYQIKYGEGFTYDYSNMYDTPNYPIWEKAAVIANLYSYAATQTWRFKNSVIKIVLLNDIFDEYLYEGNKYQEVYRAYAPAYPSSQFKTENEYKAYVADIIMTKIYEQSRQHKVNKSVGIFYVSSFVLKKYKNSICEQEKSKKDDAVKLDSIINEKSRNDYMRQNI